MSMTKLRATRKTAMATKRPALLTAGQAAQMLGLDAAAFRRGIREGRIPRPVTIAAGGHMWWLQSEVMLASLAPRTHGGAASDQ